MEVGLLNGGNVDPPICFKLVVLCGLSDLCGKKTFIR